MRRRARRLGNVQGDGARLLKAIITPSMILVFLTGFTLVYLTEDWRDGWWRAKFVLVLGLAGLHGYFARCVRTFAEDANGGRPVSIGS